MIFVLIFLADMALPHHLMQVGRSPVLVPELCLQTGRTPYPGQTLQADKSCPSGLRWRFQK